MEQYVFTPASVLDLLTQIEELADYDIGLTETFDGKFRLTIGESVYDIEPQSAEDIEVDDEVVDAISDTNEDTYSDLEESGVVSISDEDVDITSGIIKETLKTLLIGGMARLSSKWLGQDALGKKKKR